MARKSWENLTSPWNSGHSQNWFYFINISFYFFYFGSVHFVYDRKIQKSFDEIHIL